MSIEFKELTEFTQFNECLLLQEKIFGLSDVDKVPPPYIGMLARKGLPIGIVLGAFDKEGDREKGKMVGFLFSTATFVEKSIYCVLVGVLPEYQGRDVGLGLFSRLRDMALKRSIKDFYCIFDVLAGNLGNFYFNKIGLSGIHYEITPFELANGNEKREIIVPVDVLYVHGELDSRRIREKLAGAYKKRPLDEVFSRYPLVTEDDLDANSEAEAVLVEIPENFAALRKHDPAAALKWRMSTGKIFNEYINNRGFHITEFYSRKGKDSRHNYYLLEQRTRS